MSVNSKKYWVIPEEVQANVMKEVLGVCCHMNDVTAKYPKLSTSHKRPPSDVKVALFKDEFVSEVRLSTPYIVFSEHMKDNLRVLNFTFSNKGMEMILDTLPEDGYTKSLLNSLYEKFPEKFLDETFSDSSRTRREENTIHFMRTLLKTKKVSEGSEVEYTDQSPYKSRSLSPLLAQRVMKGNRSTADFSNNSPVLLLVRYPN